MTPVLLRSEQNSKIFYSLFLLIYYRFKDHVQNNLPRDILTTEQFIQLRRELASTANNHNGEDEPPEDNQPSGIEDITDPAKVSNQHF